ncbi:HDOD domain-containing protein [Pelagicoccus sp. SDUM812003]|uniref:HDOD domain-containing protein n=1 Tax=Pelagicoccus sp. SDUM812003 TaxID=3041267 RepID=UPI00280CC1A1|nr:HDOD domain-containing protein [Pelagicoccus sp. SDUM812003]MDQ8205326.1 HDOD domain-containing protein [Pelagicoccus sp. SDUM812003]
MNTISPIDLKNAAKQLPPSPRIFGKLGRLLKDPETDLNDITNLVNADSSLTAQVLRLSNSAMYSMGMSVDTLEEAINRIGFRELYKLVGIAASSQIFSEHNATYNISGAALWENSLACSIGMELLARKTGMDEQEAYTIGLLRNMGKMVINHCVQDDERFPRYEASNTQPLIDWEESNFGITNPSVAGFILVSWNFTEESSQTIQYQYTPEAAPRKLPLIALLNLSNCLAERIGRGIRGESVYWANWQEQLPRTGLSTEELDETETELVQTLEKVVHAFD